MQAKAKERRKFKPENLSKWLWCLEGEMLVLGNSHTLSVLRYFFWEGSEQTTASF